METIPINNSTIAEIVADDYRTAEIFKRHGIDFCCGGKKSVSKVCSEKNIDEQILQAELNASKNNAADVAHDFKSWSLTFLADYIVNVHHTYVNNNLALISEFASKVAKVHGHHNTETVEIDKLWKEVVADLTTHMNKEELVLFPYVRNLEEFRKRGSLAFRAPHFVTVINPVHMMEREHEVVGEIMHKIQVLSNNFTPPEYACNTYRVLYAKLDEFQGDLHQHIHLENNILFPKAISLEQEMKMI